MGSVLRQADVTMEIIVFDDSAEGRVRDIVAASGLIRLCITSLQQLRGLRRSARGRRHISPSKIWRSAKYRSIKIQWHFIAMTALTKGTSCCGM